MSTRSYVEQPGDLDIAVVDDLIITHDMIAQAAEQGYSYSSKSTIYATDALLEVVPFKKNATILITAHVKNIYYARMPALVDLINLADGYYVFGDTNSSTTSTLQFTMNNRSYDNESPQRNGTISTTLTAFGSLGDRMSSLGHDESIPIMLDMLFQLIDED